MAPTATSAEESDKIARTGGRRKHVVPLVSAGPRRQDGRLPYTSTPYVGLAKLVGLVSLSGGVSLSH